MKVVTHLWRAFRGLSVRGQVATGAAVGVLLLAAVGAGTEQDGDTHVEADAPTTVAEETTTTTTTLPTTTTESTTTTTTTTTPPTSAAVRTTSTTAAVRTTTTQRATTTTMAVATTQRPQQQHQQQRDCDPSYPDVCIPSPPPDLDCPEVQYKNFRVVGSDPHGFDRDRDGIGCET